MLRDSDSSNKPDHQSGKTALIVSSIGFSFLFLGLLVSATPIAINTGNHSFLYIGMLLLFIGVNLGLFTIVAGFVLVIFSWKDHDNSQLFIKWSLIINMLALLMWLYVILKTNIPFSPLASF